MGAASSSELVEGASALARDEDVEERHLEGVLPRTALATLDVFAVLHPDAVRDLLRDRPRNLARLVLKCIDVLHDAAVNQGAQPPSSVGKVSNAVHVLTRLLPILFEDADVEDEPTLLTPPPPAAQEAPAADSAASAIAEANADTLPPPPPYPRPPQSTAACFVQRFFWEGLVPKVGASADEGAGSGSSDMMSAASWEAIEGLEEGAPPGRMLVHAVMACLYLPDYTVSAEQFHIFSAKISESQARRAAREARAEALRARAEAAARGDAVETRTSIQRELAAEGAGAGAVAVAAGAGAPSAADAEEGEVDAEEAAKAAVAAVRQDQGAVAAGEDEEEEDDEEDDDDGGPIADEANALWPMLLWKEGVGFSKLLMTAASAAMLANRADCLRLLIAICSQTLFVPPTPQRPARSKFTDVATGEGCPFAPTLLFSLINTIVCYDPVGLGVPYATAVLGDRDAANVNMAVRALLVLLDYAPLDLQHGRRQCLIAAHAAADARAAVSAAAPGAAAEAAEAAAVEAETAAAAAIAAEEEGGAFVQYNVYRSLLSGMREPDDLDLLYSALCRLLQTVPAAESALLPGSYHAISCQQEVLLLLWKLLDENDEFRAYVLQHCDVTACAAPVLLLMWSSRNSPSKVGLVHLCTFILLLLSGERAFGVGLNERVTQRTPSDLPLFEGSHADLLIIVLHKLIVDGAPKLSTLYSCFLTIIGNVSPYSKGLGLVAAAKLVNLLELFSSPAFLFARPNNFVFVQQLLETFNNVLQYQYESNGVLTYSIVRRKEVFERLASASVAQWRAEQQARSQAAASTRKTIARAVAGRGSDAAAAAAAATASDEAAAGGSGGWVATEAWCSDMVRELPLLTIERLLAYLAPLLEEFVRRQDNIVDDDAVVAFIRSTTVVGVLPVPHAILMRKYVPNSHTSLWFTTLCWSTVFLGLVRDVPMLDSEAIKLFSIAMV